MLILFLWDEFFLRICEHFVIILSDFVVRIDFQDPKFKRFDGLSIGDSLKLIRKSCSARVYSNLLKEIYSTEFVEETSFQECLYSGLYYEFD